ncbi:hypothetical protein STHAL_04610 [Streptomyces halstedii]|uniref:DNA-binding response regulator n=1 Tax=Streptomyces halstedii TaxID=1944 RepID=A0ABS6TKM9_STRHA|nr:hypothetical protein [Streptomyces halstedii]MBV7668780.1 hypothetical protein [Streptomyces halstedii]
MNDVAAHSDRITVLAAEPEPAQEVIERLLDTGHGCHRTTHPAPRRPGRQ